MKNAATPRVAARPVAPRDERIGQNSAVPNEDAPGWDAIDAAIAPIVGDQAPLHWATGTHLPDQEGVWGISAYALDRHWFFITYGLSELFTKNSDDAAVSGWGEELTLRLRRDGDTPPEWPVRLLARLGELVFQRSTPFRPGGRIEIPDPVDGAPPALAWAEDPLLAPLNGPFGSVEFVATVGVSMATLEQMRATSTAEVLADVRAGNPWLICQEHGLVW